MSGKLCKAEEGNEHMTNDVTGREFCNCTRLKRNRFVHSRKENKGILPGSLFLQMYCGLYGIWPSFMCCTLIPKMPVYVHRTLHRQSWELTLTVSLLELEFRSTTETPPGVLGRCFQGDLAEYGRPGLRVNDATPQVVILVFMKEGSKLNTSIHLLGSCHQPPQAPVTMPLLPLELHLQIVSQ